jgi:hypothetical protein
VSGSSSRCHHPSYEVVPSRRMVTCGVVCHCWSHCEGLLPDDSGKTRKFVSNLHRVFWLQGL